MCPCPSLLAVSAVHQHLVKTKKRTALAVDSGIRRTAERCIISQRCLGYGASAVNPYLAQDTITELVDQTDCWNKDYYAAVDDYNHAVLAAAS